MGFIGPGKPISELIEQLEEIQEEHGDIPCYSGVYELKTPNIEHRGPGVDDGRNDEKEHVYL